MAFVINRTDFFLCKNAVSPDGETAFCIVRRKGMSKPPVKLGVGKSYLIEKERTS